MTHAGANSDGDIWKAIFFAGCVAVLGFWLFLRALKSARAISAIPRSMLRSAAQGYVELHGTTKQLPGEPITAPLTRRSCVWYSYSIDKKTKDSKGNTEWSTVESGRSSTRFELHDETGHCIVDPRGAEVTAERRDCWYGASLKPVHGPDAKRSLWSAGEYRYTEQRIEEDRPLYVWGNFHTLPLRTGMSTRVNELLQTWKADQALLVERFDANRDGVVDGVEWEQARRTAEDSVSQTGAAQSGVMNLVDRPAEADHVFILSSQNEADLLKKYWQQFGLGVAMFLLGGAAFVWMVGSQLGN